MCYAKKSFQEGERVSKGSMCAQGGVSQMHTLCTHHMGERGGGKKVRSLAHVLCTQSHMIMAKSKYSKSYSEFQSTAG